MKEETVMDKITTAMAEYVCGKLCQFYREPICGQIEDGTWGELNNESAECDSCEMSQHLCNILNEYNRLNDFEKSQCADLLKRLGAEREKHRWISVGERLPECGKRVLICSVGGWISIAWRGGDGWREDYGSECLQVGYVVAAWQPLPEPYDLEDI